ncbi:MAG: PhoPQ-activated protein PqaA family protein [Phycisphaerales bacterium]
MSRRIPYSWPLVVLVVCLLPVVAMAQTGPLAPSPQPSATVERGGSLLDEYTSERDGSFAWKVVRSYVGSGEREGAIGFAIDLTSQTWRGLPDGGGETDFPAWTHMLQVVVPDEVRHDTALLLVGGGQRQAVAPPGLQEELWTIALATGSIVAAVPNVPNQPLSLPDEDGTLGDIRFEDDLLAESWMLAKRTGDPSWVIHLAMVESVLAAMDAVQQFASSEEGGGHEIGGFVVSGASKRGWTAWLTAAVDDRVRGIIPMVIDTLNLPETMRHHYGAYGFFAPAIGDYAGRNLMQELDTPEGLMLRRIVDPYLFRHRLTMPKFVLNTTGDQYFLPDTPRYWIDDLPGDTRLRVVQNLDHAIDRSLDAIFSAIGFYEAILNDVELPDVGIEVVEEGDDAVEWLVSVRIPDDRVTLRRLTLWQGTNPTARDFREETIGKPFRMRMLLPEGDGPNQGKYRVRVEKPDTGYTAFFVEHRYDVRGQQMPLVFTTQVQIIPDVLEHAFEGHGRDGDEARVPADP